MYESLSTALKIKDPDNKNLEQITELIWKEGKLRMPWHQRRVQFFKAKKGSEKHNNFLDRLGNLLSVVEFDSMTGDEMAIHLFDECAASQMSRIAIDLLAKENPTMQNLKIKVKETEKVKG